jgi:hypothetical protein
MIFMTRFSRPPRESRTRPVVHTDWQGVFADTLPAELLLPRLRGVVRQSDREWTACCPAHPDQRPSLSISETDDFEPLVFCHARTRRPVDKTKAAVGLQVCLHYLIQRASGLTQGMPQALRDPRLSRAGNWLAKYLAQALEALVRVENWLRTPNERELRAQDREILQPLLDRVGDQAGVVAELVLGPDLKRERMP